MCWQKHTFPLVPLSLSLLFSPFTLTLVLLSLVCTPNHPSLCSNEHNYLFYLLSSVNGRIENGKDEKGRHHFHLSNQISDFVLWTRCIWITFGWNRLYITVSRKLKIGTCCWKETKKREGKGLSGKPSVMCSQSWTFHPRPSCDCPRISLIPFLVSGKVDRDHPKADLLLWK